jgi:uncharacterized protein with FMN-binding domain
MGDMTTNALSSAEVNDDVMADRLARLAARTPSKAGSPVAATSQVGARRKRRHAAKKSRYAALALSLVSTAGATFASLDAGTSTQIAGSGGIVSTSGIVTASTPAAGGTVSIGTADPVTTAATTRATVPMTQTETVVNGDVFTNKWGPVQVQATFGADGSLLGVDTLQTPFQDDKSVRINDRAVPVLNSEALSAQSSAVHTVSGATYTSDDYQRSLQSAIDTARAAGLTELA